MFNLIAHRTHRIRVRATLKPHRPATNTLGVLWISWSGSWIFRATPVTRNVSVKAEARPRGLLLPLATTRAVRLFGTPVASARSAQEWGVRLFHRGLGIPTGPFYHSVPREDDIPIAPMSDDGEGLDRPAPARKPVGPPTLHPGSHVGRLSA